MFVLQKDHRPERTAISKTHRTLPIYFPERAIKPLQDPAMPWAVQLPDTCPPLKPGCRQQLHNLFLRGWRAHHPLNYIPRSPRPLAGDGLLLGQHEDACIWFHGLSQVGEDTPAVCQSASTQVLSSELFTLPNSPAYDNTAKCLFINGETSFWRSEAICPGLHNP